MKIVVQLSRILVGALFIFSGFFKLVDPIGSQYKFQEYFSESVLNMEFLIPYALPFAILLIVAEYQVRNKKIRVNKNKLQTVNFDL